MAHEQINIPLPGDILDDLAMAFREIYSKVSYIVHIFFLNQISYAYGKMLISI